MQKIIVDGYNVIHADPGLRPGRGVAIQTAREELLARLRAYVARKDEQVTVVFDGRGGIADSEPLVAGRLQVVYSAAGQSADELILRAIRSRGNPREYIVVTSDMADIGRAARGMGAVVMSSLEFLDRIAPVERATPEAAAQPSDGDVDYWLQRFEERRAEEGDSE